MIMMANEEQLQSLPYLDVYTYMYYLHSVLGLLA
jgi:hypothetical protein